MPLNRARPARGTGTQAVPDVPQPGRPLQRDPRRRRSFRRSRRRAPSESPASQPITATASRPCVATGTPARCARRREPPYTGLGSTRQRIGTCPERPSTRRTSSRYGASPPVGSVIASVTRALPLGRRERRLENVRARQVAASRFEGLVGRNSKRPPRWASTIAPNMLGESRSGRQSQSMAPSRATSATVRPSPMAA